MTTWASGRAFAADSVQWLTGPQLEQRLNLPASVSWSNNPVGSALRNLAAENAVALVIDRRVDTSRRMQLNAAAPLYSLFEKIAKAYNEAFAGATTGRAATPIGVSQVGPVVYIGPQGTAKYLRTLAELRKDDLRSLPVAARGAMVRLRAWHWDDLATPRELIEALSRESGVDIIGRQQVPHDLWRGNDLPPLNFVDRLTLLAAQFDLTYHFQTPGNRAVLEPIKTEGLSIERSYPGGARPEVFAAQLRKALPEASVRVEGAKVFVRGLMETHEEIRNAMTRGAKTAAKPGVKQVFTFQARNVSLQAAIDKIATDFKLMDVELKVDRRAIGLAGIKLDQRVTFQVEKVDIDGLLTALLSNTGLTHRRLGNVIEIVPAK